MIRHKKLIWQLFPANVLTILIAVIGVSWFCFSSLQEFHASDTKSDLEARANLVSFRVRELLNREDLEELQNYIIKAGRSTFTRVTVVDAAGKVLADSHENPEVMDNHRHRVEIEQAFDGKVGVSSRYSSTLDEQRVYVAIGLRDLDLSWLGPEEREGLQAVVRTSVSVASLYDTLTELKMRIMIGAALVMLLAGIVTLVISRNLSRPLEQMTRSAERYSRGDFTERMVPRSRGTASSEVMTLAASMDRMAELLDEKIQTIVTHRNQLQTVFSSMLEAVIAINQAERIISINQAAANLLGVDRGEAQDKLMQQVVRNIQLQQYIHHTLISGEPIEEEILFRERGEERCLQANVVTLTNGAGERFGVLVVMNDVTRLRRLEMVRRDFVANVSHELRTPITSIKGYVETLLDGALDNRADAEKFLKIVLGQTDRLMSIIEDLLALSRIEASNEEKAFALRIEELAPVLHSAVQECRLQAEQAGVSVRVDSPSTLQVALNPNLMVQALVNLLLNAIAHSTSGSEVLLKAGLRKSTAGQEEVIIEVQDKGSGIAREHLPRLFERFYRSDRGRSRVQGGSGLGLAIVKHIVQVHQGTVEVESQQGIGSTFRITLKVAELK